MLYTLLFKFKVVMQKYANSSACAIYSAIYCNGTRSAKVYTLKTCVFQIH